MVTWCVAFAFFASGSAMPQGAAMPRKSCALTSDAVVASDNVMLQRNTGLEQQGLQRHVAATTSGRRRRRRRRNLNGAPQKKDADLSTQVADLTKQLAAANAAAKKKIDTLTAQNAELTTAVQHLAKQLAAAKAAGGGGFAPHKPVPSKPAPLKKGETRITGEQDVKVGDFVRINYAKYSINGKWGKVTHVSAAKGVIINGPGITGTGYIRFDRVVKLDKAPKTTTTTTTTEGAAALPAKGSVRLEKVVARRTSMKLCLGMYKVEYPHYANKREEMDNTSHITKLTGETSQTQHMVFLAPCSKYSGRALIHTTGDDDAHIRWVKQSSGFYKNVQYGMCLRWPKSSAKAYSKNLAAMHLGIGTMECDEKRAGPFIEDTGHLKLACSHHGKERGKGLKQSACLCAFHENHPLYAAMTVREGLGKFKPYTYGAYCGNKNPLKMKEFV